MTPAAPHHAQVSLSVPGKRVERPSRRLSCRPRVALPWAFTPSRSCARPGGSAARDAHFGGSSPVAGEKLWVSQSYLGIPKRGSQGPRDQPTTPTSAKHPPLAKPPSPAGACSAPHEMRAPPPAGLHKPRACPLPLWSQSLQLPWGLGTATSATTKRDYSVPFPSHLVPCAWLGLLPLKGLSCKKLQSILPGNFLMALG